MIRTNVLGKLERTQIAVTNCRALWENLFIITVTHRSAGACGSIRVIDLSRSVCSRRTHRNTVTLVVIAGGDTLGDLHLGYEMLDRRRHN